MGQTTTYNLPYPELGDAPNCPGQVQALAEAVDSTLAAQITNVQDTIDGFVQPLYATRTTEQAWSVGTTLTSDPALVLNLTDPKGIYNIRGSVFYDAGSIPLYQCRFLIPAGSTFNYNISYHDNSDDPYIRAQGNESVTNAYGSGAGTLKPIQIDGTIIMGGTAGNLQFQAANQTTGGAGWTHYPGSYLRAEKTGETS